MGEAARGTLRAKGFTALWTLALMASVAFSLALASASGAWADEAAPVADDDIFVALYSRDGGGYTLVFQKGEGARAEYGPLEDIQPFRDDANAPAHQWIEEEKRPYVVEAVVADAFQPQSAAWWFYDLENLEQVNMAKLDTSKVKSARRMFHDCRSLKSVDLSKFETTSLEDASQMFAGCSSLVSLDLSKFDTSKVTDMSQMFLGCSSLKSLSFPKSFRTGAVVNISGMFTECASLKTLDLSGFDTSRATDMNNMFSKCSSLETIVLPVTFQTSIVTDMSYMFSGCSSLKSLDLSRFDTSKVTDMKWMFNGCSSLKVIQFPATFTTGWVTDMGYMFNGCTSLQSLDLSHFDTSKVTGMREMFRGCSSLTSLDLSKFDTSKVTDMHWMFAECTSLKSIDLSGFDTSKAQDMGEMFRDCSSLESLDLSRFDMTLAENSSYRYMLSGCDSLNSISLPATGDFAKADLPNLRDGKPLKWRNEKGKVFAAAAIPVRTAGTYVAVVEEDGSDGSGGGNGSGNGSGDNGGSNNGSGNGNDSGNGSGPGSNNPSPKRTVAFSEAVALPLDATGVAMGKDDIARDLAKRFGSREGFPADAEGVTVTIKYGGEEVDVIDPRRAGTYEVMAIYTMPDGTERVIEATYTVADPAAKTPVKSTVKSAARLAQTGDEATPAVPLATAALAACAPAAAVAVRHRARG
ncbi:DUF285 domain-containing protein [Adlercreutzia muris]|uniref:DUF285 domain-containing protein n=1 Tax=Adlercreutzia muris TaxID=1796610 RepID=UPI001F57A223|nr:DUF285 domain-containing protein [Adlercreutzia muris]